MRVSKRTELALRTAALRAARDVRSWHPDVEWQVYVAQVFPRAAAEPREQEVVDESRGRTPLAKRTETYVQKDERARVHSTMLRSIGPDVQRQPLRQVGTVGSRIIKTLEECQSLTSTHTLALTQ